MKKPPPLPADATLPLCLSRDHWAQVLAVLTKARQNKSRIEEALLADGEMVVLDIHPDRVKWLAGLLTGDLREEVWRQWWFWTRTDHSIFDRAGQFVFELNNPPYEPEVAG